MKGYSGIKPGWCRISLHYAMDDIEVKYILDAIEFVAEQGYRFMPLYDFDINTGAWLHKADCVCLEGFSLDAALECRGYQSRALSEGERKTLYGAFLSEAQQLADGLATEQAPEEHEMSQELEELKFFSVPKISVNA